MWPNDVVEEELHVICDDRLTIPVAFFYLFYDFGYFHPSIVFNNVSNNTNSCLCDTGLRKAIVFLIFYSFSSLLELFMLGKHTSLFPELCC